MEINDNLHSTLYPSSILFPPSEIPTQLLKIHSFHPQKGKSSSHPDGNDHHHQFDIIAPLIPFSWTGTRVLMGVFLHPHALYCFVNPSRGYSIRRKQNSPMGRCGPLSDSPSRKPFSDDGRPWFLCFDRPAWIFEEIFYLVLFVWWGNHHVRWRICLVMKGYCILSFFFLLLPWGRGEIPTKPTNCSVPKWRRMEGCGTMRGVVKNNVGDEFIFPWRGFPRHPSRPDSDESIHSQSRFHVPTSLVARWRQRAKSLQTLMIRQNR